MRMLFIILFVLPYLTAFSQESDPLTEVPPSGIPVTFSALENKKSGTPDLKWKIEEEHARLIEGFVVELDTATFDWVAISDTLPPDTRTWKDQSSKKEGSYKYRIKAILKGDNGFKLSGKKSFYYAPIPDQPGNLHGYVRHKDGKKYVQLQWDMPADTEVREYYVYMKPPGYSKFGRHSSLPDIEDTKVSIPMSNFLAKKYTYKVCAANTLGVESEFSNEFEIIVPGDEMPSPFITEVEMADNQITLSWNMREVLDLDKFEIYINDELTATLDDESLRQWTSEPLEPGKYYFKIRSISSSGLNSRMSNTKRYFFD